MGMLTKYNRRDLDPFSGFQALQDEINKLFDTSVSRWPFSGRSGLFETGWMPLVDVHEDKDNVYVKAELPGITKEDIDIAIQGNLLTLKGEKKTEYENKKENTYRAERMFGTFTRSIELPMTVEASKVSAKYRDGILEIVLPKSEEAKPKQIKIDVK